MISPISTPLRWISRKLTGGDAVRGDELRASGDAARDARQWQDAADTYRRYLTVNRRDFGIWVQLGHALKESGALDRAMAAYLEAATLRSDDADLFLNIGHLHKLRGEHAEAATAYARSLRVGGTVDARRELNIAEVAAALAPDLRSVVDRFDRTSLQHFADRVSGARAIFCSDIVLDANGGMSLLSNDPFAQFSLLPELRAAPAITVTFNAESRDGTELHSRLYVDYGRTLNEHETIDFALAGNKVLVLVAPDQLRDLRWDPDVRPGSIMFRSIEFRAVSTAEELMATLDVSADPVARGRAEALTRKLFKDPNAKIGEPLTFSKLLMPAALDRRFDYIGWSAQYIEPSAQNYEHLAGLVGELERRPTFSFVMPTYNTPPSLLRECLDALLAQTYQDFEICIADDASPHPQVRQILEEFAARYDKIKWVQRKRNGHISAASNTAMQLATGDFIVLVDHDDLIPDYTLAIVAIYINKYPHGRIFYSDEDKVSVDGVRFDPYFKSEFNRYLMYGHNMISHLGVYDRQLLQEIGGFRKGLEGSQDYDLALRAYERVGDDAVIHIPHVLYHWRTVPGSTAISADQKGYAVVAAQAAINSHFDRLAKPLRAVDGFAPGLTAIVPTAEYDTPITIIIPTRDGVDLLRACIASIDRCADTAVDILIVDNGSEERATLAYLELLASRPDVTVLDYPHSFNFAKINNFAAEKASGEILCFLNNDTEVVAEGWLARARGLLKLDEIGAVGARLCYEDGILQHFGIGLGMAQHRVAGTPHAGKPLETPGYFGKARLIQEVSAVTAACMFVRKTVFDVIGGFDPELRVAYNDVDFCLRVREKGYRILVDPEIVLVHKESRTRGYDVGGEKAARLDREAAIMRERWGETLDHDPYLSPNISLDDNDFSLAYPPRVAMPWHI